MSLEQIAGPAAKPLMLGVAAFLSGLGGVILAFAIDYGPQEPLSAVALGIVAIAVVAGFSAVVWGWVLLFRRQRRTNLR